MAYIGLGKDIDSVYEWHFYWNDYFIGFMPGDIFPVKPDGSIVSEYEDSRHLYEALYHSRKKIMFMRLVTACLSVNNTDIDCMRLMDADDADDVFRYLEQVMRLAREPIITISTTVVI